MTETPTLTLPEKKWIFFEVKPFVARALNIDYCDCTKYESVALYRRINQSNNIPVERISLPLQLTMELNSQKPVCGKSRWQNHLTGVKNLTIIFDIFKFSLQVKHKNQKPQNYVR